MCSESFVYFFPDLKEKRRALGRGSGETMGRITSRMAASWWLMCLVLIANLVSQDGGRGCAALSPDGETLLAVKSTIIDPTGALNDWVSSGGSQCNWTAVECDEGWNVIGLNLSTKNLTGSISSAIGSLSHLTNLSLDSNNFTGSLPAELSSLVHLQLLNITNNGFSGALPVGLSNLTHLEVLDCYNNYLSGVLPLEIVSLQNLKHLHLGGNNFRGSIPAAYGNFSSSLLYMSLSGNALTGSIPPELGNLTSLNYFYLGWFNSFQGGIPRELGNLGNLVLLDLASCQLTGSIPAELGNLTQLETLFLYSNNLSGILPPNLSSLLQLKSLDLSINNLNGSIPESYGGLSNLTLLNLFENFLNGDIPSSLGDLPNLEVLQLWMNNLTGSLPQQLGSSSENLFYLDVSNNQLTGELPQSLCQGGNLQSLITKENQMTGPIPDGVGNCSSLAYVRLHNNRHSGSVPLGFFNLPTATTLQLQVNNFSGTLPDEIQTTSLSTLDLSNNQLEGRIPPSIGNLHSLLVLHLSGNRFSGSIPSTICDMRGLYDIELESNGLEGEIPSTLGNCSALMQLDLSQNYLTGPIPTSLLDLGVLAILDVSNNRLGGGIPDGLGAIQSLTQVDFSYNNFSGPVPTLGNFRSFNESSYRGNPFLCGGVGIPECPSNGTNGTSGGGGKRNNGGPNLLAWLVGALFSIATLVFLLGLCCFCRRYKFHIARMLRKEGTVRPWKFTPFQRLEFTARELVDCLSEENIIGRGGAGTVFRGEMANGDMVAVKRLACGKGTSSYDHGFSAEIRTLGKIRHRYIVRLLGFCTNNEMNLLVYEFMPNGSLGEFLHDPKKSALLDWTTRYNIALQAATGLCYLHHDCSPLILHRDVKSNNILLDSNLEAHVADFGLAKLFQDTGQSESMSSIAGSYGYIAPEYAYTLKVNEKSDIYSFGVVLMELLTGKRPIEAEFGDGVDIVQWIRLKIQTREGVLEILDPTIGVGSVAIQEVMLVLRVALLCSSDHPADRPTMRDVVQMLSHVRPLARTTSADNRRELKPPQPVPPTEDPTEDLLIF